MGPGLGKVGGRDQTLGPWVPRRPGGTLLLSLYLPLPDSSLLSSGRWWLSARLCLPSAQVHILTLPLTV